MGAALGCSCETKDDQAEVSLVQPVTNHAGKRQQRDQEGVSPSDDSELMQGGADASVCGNGHQEESMPQQRDD